MNKLIKCIFPSNRYEYVVEGSYEEDGYLYTYTLLDNKVFMTIEENILIRTSHYYADYHSSTLDIACIREYDNEDDLFDALEDLNTILMYVSGELSFELSKSELERLKALYAEEFI